MLSIPQKLLLLGRSGGGDGLMASPAELSGLSVWSDPSDIGTLTIDGSSRVNSELDKSGNNRHFTQANASNAFWALYIPNAQNGRAMLRFGGGTGQNLSTPSFLATGHSEITVFIVKKPNVATPSIDVSHSATGFYSSTNQNNWKMIEHQSSGIGGFMGNVGKGNGECFLETFRYGGGIRSLGIDYRLLDRAQTGTIGLSGGFFLGTNAPSGFPGRVDIGEVIIYNRALSNSETFRVIDYLRNKWNFAVLENKNYTNILFVFLGDSRTVGLGSGVGQAYSLNYPNKLMELIGSGNYRNFGISNDQVAGISTRATSQVIPIYNPNLSKNIVVVWGGTNDLAFTGTSGTDIAIAYGNICQNLRNAGFTVILCTEIDRANAGLRADFQTRRADLNAYHLANWTNYADRIVNFANQPLLHNTGAALNTLYFDPDATHLIPAGNDLVANEIKIQADSILTDSVIPINAILDHNNQPILDQNSDFILS